MPWQENKRQWLFADPAFPCGQPGGRYSLAQARNKIKERPMADIDLTALDLDELKQLQKDVDKAIRDYETRRKQEALAKAEAAAKEAGYSLSELFDDTPKKGKKGPANPPKYRHPENPELTWSGRGRQPGWIKEALEQGKPLNDYLIG
jgi:DNA-binding protein H-NS